MSRSGSSSTPAASSAGSSPHEGHRPHDSDDDQLDGASDPATKAISRIAARTDAERSLEWARTVDWLFSSAGRHMLRPQSARRAVSLLERAPESPEAPAIALLIASKVRRPAARS